jgi:hypothetical protein
MLLFKRSHAQPHGGFILRSDHGTFLAGAASTIEHVKSTHTAKERAKEQIKYKCKWEQIK